MEREQTKPLEVEFVRGVQVLGALAPGYDEILSEPALQFVADLDRRFRQTRQELLSARVERQRAFDLGQRPAFIDATQAIRDGDWQVAEIPDALRERRVEITGPVSRKMVINALNSGADMFMADFEDASAPTWANMIEGQVNLRDAVRRDLGFEDPRSGKRYTLQEKVATLLVRPRGWHLDEAHVRVDGEAVSASIFDFGLYFFHNAKESLTRGAGPYFYLPKLESHLEARLWNDVFVAAQDLIGLPNGSIRATVLIETLPAAFEMDEILWELRDHSAGLNCGRWDYIFSFIKCLRADPSAVIADRGLVGMTEHFLRSYSQLVIKTCHRRGIHAMGGMAAQIPIKNDEDRNAAAMAKVHADKQREAKDGHDGTWVAHPGLIPIAREEFDAVMTGPNQIDVEREDVGVTGEDLLRVPTGPMTEAGLRQNLEVGVRYLESWLRGSGCVPIHDLMEDAATAEISRAQVWQQVKHHARLDDGTVIDAAFVQKTLGDEMDKIRQQLGESGWAESRFPRAAELFEAMVLAGELAPFLTSAAYPDITTIVA